MSIIKYSNLALLLAALSLSLMSNSTIYAEDSPADTCKSAASLFEEGDIEGALEEAEWCVTLLKQLKQGEISTFFKDEVHKYKGGKLEQQEAINWHAGVHDIEKLVRACGRFGAMTTISGEIMLINHVHASQFYHQWAAGTLLREDEESYVMAASDGIVVLMKRDIVERLKKD